MKIISDACQTRLAAHQTKTKNIFLKTTGHVGLHLGFQVANGYLGNCIENLQLWDMYAN